MDLKPSPAWKSRYRFESILVFVLAIFSWSIPVTILIPTGEVIFALLAHMLAIVLLIFILWWIPRFYETLNFALDDKQVVSRYGIFFKQERRVDLKKINMVQTTQGPIQRHFRTKHLHMHTAALGGQPIAEVTFYDLTNADEIQKKISQLMESRGVADRIDVGAKETSVIEELTKIRRIMEEKRADDLKKPRDER